MGLHPKQHTSPCKDCPFRSTGEATLGGSPPEVYIGQVNGPYLLPCHNQPGYDPGMSGAEMLKSLQCAGAAIFRSNVGVAERFESVKDRVLILPPGHPEVFKSYEEFAQFHTGLTADEAAMLLMLTPPDYLTAIALAQPGVRRAVDHG